MKAQCIVYCDSRLQCEVCVHTPQSPRLTKPEGVEEEKRLTVHYQSHQERNSTTPEQDRCTVVGHSNYTGKMDPIVRVVE